MATSTTRKSPALSGIDKVGARRDELARAALRTLAERGYANTSLRDISQHSEFSHGVLHYYFHDKVELIIHCVALYKSTCVHRYDGVDAAAADADELVDRFVDALRATVTEDAHEQRLWYDMRAQSLFEPRFVAPVAAIDDVLRAMVWRILSRLQQLAGTRAIVDADTAYAVLDGIVSHAVQAHLAGDADAVTVLEHRVRTVLERLQEPVAA